PKTGDLFVWDAMRAEHEQIMHHFGIQIDWQGDEGELRRHVYDFSPQYDIQNLFRIQEEVRANNAAKKHTASLGLSKFASFDGAAWVDPKGKIYRVDTYHQDWINNNLGLLEQKYHYDPGMISIDYLLQIGWTRIANWRDGEGYLQIYNFKSVPPGLQPFLDENYNWEGGRPIVIDDITSDYKEVDVTGDIQQDINNAKKRKYIGSLHTKAFEGPATTWDGTEPYTPLPTTFEWGTNDDNLNSRYPWKFMRKPVGPNYSNEGEVDEMLVNEEEGDDKPVEKKAATPFRGWVDPNGKLYPLEHGEAHGNWIKDHLSLLKKSGVTLKSAASGQWVQAIEELISDYGWIRVDGGPFTHSTQSFSIMVNDLSDIHSNADTIAMFLQPNDQLFVEDVWGNQGVVLIAPVNSVQKEVRRKLMENKVHGESALDMPLSKFAKRFEIENSYGDTVGIIENPTFNEAAGLLRRSPERLLRFLVEPNGILLIWNAIAATHIDVASNLGIDYKNSNTGYLRDEHDIKAIMPKKASLQVKARSAFAAWIDPEGLVYEIRKNGRGGTHIGWIEDNLALLHDKYGYSLPEDRYAIFDLLLKNNWVRIGDSMYDSHGISVQLADMKNIPRAVDSYIAGIYEDGMRVEVEESASFSGKGKTVVVDNPFPTLQKAVNRALKNPEHIGALSKQAFSTVGFWVAPDGKIFDARAAGTHGDWIAKNNKILKSYGINAKGRDYYDVAPEMLQQGWARIGDTSNGFGVELQ
ncbi:MAG: hypothetical protein ACREHV_16335, partial [Rhizomicrobium sp.]